MSTTPITPGVGRTAQPAIPLTPELRTNYEDLYAQYEDSIEATNDPTLKESLMDSQLAVAAVISADNEARIQQTTASFAALLKQMNATNKGLDDLQTQIKKVASDLSIYAGVLGGIAKVLTLVPGI